jgi:RNA methyltransferase, TrmH family
MKQNKKNQEMKVYGRHACLSLFKYRPLDLIRLYVTRDGVFDFKEMVRFCVDHKLAYHVVEKEELDTITKSTHHEGIALVARIRKVPTVKELMDQKGRSLILALESVENPHNLGAIIRTCAHYGVSGIVYEAKVPVALSAAAQRTAEGGAEVVPAVQISEWDSFLVEARRQNYKIFATSSHQGESLFSMTFPSKAVVFLGAEGPGLSAKILKKVDASVTIPGSGAVESLNVSNAWTAVATEWYRQKLSK